MAKHFIMNGSKVSDCSSARASEVQSPMPCIALWFTALAMHHGLFVSLLVEQRKPYLFAFM